MAHRRVKSPSIQPKAGYLEHQIDILYGMSIFGFASSVPNNLDPTGTKYLLLYGGPYPSFAQESCPNNCSLAESKNFVPFGGTDLILPTLVSKITLIATLLLKSF